MYIYIYALYGIYVKLRSNWERTNKKHRKENLKNTAKHRAWPLGRAEAPTEVWSATAESRGGTQGSENDEENDNEWQRIARGAVFNLIRKEEHHWHMDERVKKASTNTNSIWVIRMQSKALFGHLLESARWSAERAAGDHRETSVCGNVGSGFHRDGIDPRVYCRLLHWSQLQRLLLHPWQYSHRKYLLLL